MTEHSSQYRSGLIAALASIFVYGLTPTASKILFSEHDPLLVSGLATLIGSLPFLAYLKPNARREIFAGQFLKPLLLIALIGAFANALFFIGTMKTSAMNTGLLEQIEPIYAIVLSVLFLGEKITRVQISATILMIAGASTVAYRGYSGLNLGDCLILAAPFFFQLSHLVAKRVLPLVANVFVVPAARLFYGGIVMSVAAILYNPNTIPELSNPNLWLSALIFGILFRTADLGLWYYAIRHIPLSLASSLLPIGAGISFISAIFVLHEPVGLQQILGLAMIVSGLLIMRNSSRSAGSQANQSSN